MPIRAVAIDYAGTLTTSDRRRPTGEVVRAVLHDQFSVSIPDAFVSHYDSAFWHYYSESLSDTVPRLLTATAHHTGTGLPAFDELLPALWQATGDHPVSRAAATAVQALHDLGLTCLLASNTARPAEYRRRTLEAAGLDFMIPVCSSAIGTAKPQPNFYQHVIARSGVGAENVLFVGDNWHNDVVGPLAAGMRAVWVSQTTNSQPSPRCDGAIQISHLAQLPREIGPLLAP